MNEQQNRLWQEASTERRATAIAHPNIAFIKYWGNANDELRLPANPSLSMNLGSLHTVTTVTFADDLPGDQLSINEESVTGPALDRVCHHLDLIRREAGVAAKASIKSQSNFPIGSGIASSAAAFAALSVAGAAAAGLQADEPTLSRLARRGSGSASRSVPEGYCQWLTGDDESSVATSLAPADHWDLRDLVVVVSQEHKPVGSTGGHHIAQSSSLQTARVAGVASRFETCREALLARDLSQMGPIIEQDTVIMHAVMMSSRPPLYYWNPATMAIIHATQRWQADGIPVYFTIDAGPNVHLICEGQAADLVEQEVRKISGVKEVLSSGPGGAARLIARADRPPFG